MGGTASAAFLVALAFHAARAQQAGACAGAPAPSDGGSTAEERWQRMLDAQRVQHAPLTEGGVVHGGAAARAPHVRAAPTGAHTLVAGFIDTSMRREPTWTEWLRDEPGAAARALFAVAVSALALVVPFAAGRLRICAATCNEPAAGTHVAAVSRAAAASPAAAAARLAAASPAAAATPSGQT
ncbi:hypothetical protein KFE25_004444 [Diacronema lutheri]|uniref:Uncharacterized protein n=1 Tax=Diacronema lutheri TaxID=2081491 RepID=A0A8J5X3R6_DIALT|nr:hypothetical protein KFE25_004444 [Diacronema lutheri]